MSFHFFQRYIGRTRFPIHDRFNLCHLGKKIDSPYRGNVMPFNSLEEAMRAGGVPCEKCAIVKRSKERRK